MNILDEYRELYYKELELNDRLNNKMGSHITFLTIIATAEILLWKDVFLLKEVAWLWLYAGLTLISFICFLITIYYFYKSYIGYGYSYIDLQEIKQYIEYTKIYAKQHNISSDKIPNQIENMFKRQFCEFGIKNHRYNKQKNQFQYFFTKWLCISFVALIIAYGFWIVKVNPYKNSIEGQSTQIIYIKGGQVNLKDDEKDFPEGFQPDPEASIFYETFSRHPEIKHSDIASDESDSQKENDSE